MTKIKTEQEIKDFLDFLARYCPNTTIEFYSDTIVVNNEEIELHSSVNGSETSLKCIAYEYAFIKYTKKKFEYLEFPMNTYRLDYKPHVTFSLVGQFIQCDVAITLIRDEHKYFELTLDTGLRICGHETSDHVDSCYKLTLSRVDGIDPASSVEKLQEQARELVDDILSDFTAYELRKD